MYGYLQLVLLVLLPVSDNFVASAGVLAVMAGMKRTGKRHAAAFMMFRNMALFMKVYAAARQPHSEVNITKQTGHLE